MRALECIKSGSISATGPTFELYGGYYCMVLTGGTPASGNHFDVTTLGPDGSTTVVMLAGPNGTIKNPVFGYLPPGKYSFTLTGTLSTYITLSRVPFE